MSGLHVLLATTALLGVMTAISPAAAADAVTRHVEVREGEGLRIQYALPPAIVGGRLRSDHVDLVAVPAGGSVTIDVVSASWEDLGVIAPAPIARLPPGRRPLPGIDVEVEAPFVVRHLNLARLRIAPLSYDAAARRWRSLRRLDLRVALFRGHTPPGARRVTIDSVDRHLASLVLNPADVADATTQVGAGGNTAIPAPEPSLLGPVKVLVRQEGLYRITRSELVAAGADPAGIDPHTFVMTQRGIEVAIEVTGDNDGSFDASDVIRFYGRAIGGDETSDNVYHLTAGIRPGLRMTRRPAPSIPGAATATHFMDIVHREIDVLYYGAIPDGSSSPWLWESLATVQPGVPVSTTQSVLLPGLAGTGSTAGQLDVRVQSRRETPGASPNHHVRALVNGHVVDDRAWTGLLGVTLTGSVPRGWLQAGPNQVRIENPSDLGLSIQTEYTDWFSLSYPRRYEADADRLTFAGPGPAGPARFTVTGFTGPDIALYDLSDALHPAIITEPGLAYDGASWQINFDDSIPSPPGRYLALRASAALPPDGLILDSPSDLRSRAADGADLILVVADEFEAMVEPLAALRRAQGMRVVVARLTDVYDEFNGGIAETGGIRNFVQWAFENYAPPVPSGLLLVGDATYDPKDNKGEGDNFLPARFFHAPGFGFTPTDSWFAAVTGPDPIPDLAVGRLSARNASDVAVQVGRILAYEDAPPVGALNAGVLYAADDDDPSFPLLADELITIWHPPAMAVRRIYLGNYPQTTQGAAAARSDLRQGIDAGSLATVYVGHGSRTAWAAEGLWTSNEVVALAPTGSLTFVAALNCVNGYFANLDVEPYSLGESWSLIPDRGAIAVWTPSALSTLANYQALAGELFGQLFGAREEHLGRAAWFALLDAYLAQGIDLATVQEMIFFGDPMTRLPLDWDRDGLLDRTETTGGTDSSDADSDDDGLGDGAEPAWDLDSDLDGLANGLDPDSDNDGLPDGLEAGVTAPLLSTDLARGLFVADTDPATTTNLIDADTDGGAAPDGAEDRDADGRVDPSESDPADSADDPQCADFPPLEVQHLRVVVDGDDVELSWDDLSATDPCVLYHVYVAVEGAATEFNDFVRAGTTGRLSWRHTGAVNSGQRSTYLVTATTLAHGEGPLGHFGR